MEVLYVFRSSFFFFLILLFYFVRTGGVGCIEKIPSREQSSFASKTATATAERKQVNDAEKNLVEVEEIQR